MVHFAYMPSPIPRQGGWNLFARTIPSTSAFPETGAGRLLHHYFRGLLSVHLRYGLHARQVAFATLCTRGFSSLVASPAALIATGWSEPVPGRVYPRCGPAPSRRTRYSRFGLTHYSESDISEDGISNYDHETRHKPIRSLIARRIPYPAGACRRGTSRLRNHARDSSSVRGEIPTRSRHALRQPATIDGKR